MLDRDPANRYEASQPSSPQRSYVPAFVRAARFDANSWDRWEMTRKIRYFDRNVWLVGVNKDIHTRYTVGPNGLVVEPDSEIDKKWNARMQEAYLEWCERPCYDSTMTMPQVHRVIAGSCHLEREMFILKTSAKYPGMKSIPAVQLIESHRCSSPGTIWTMKDDPERVDGVQLRKDPSGRLGGPEGYWIVDDQLGREWAFRTVDELYHVFDPERPGMYRCVSPYHAVMNTLHDLDDLELMQMEKAKNNSQIANVITVASGELNKDATRGRRFGATTLTAQDSKDDDLNKRIQNYKKVLGAATMALRRGETLKQFTSSNPSAAEQWYWIYKMGQVSKAAGVPLILVFPEMIENVNGTVVRGIYDDAHQGFQTWYNVYACAAVMMYRYFVRWAVFNDPRCVDAPADYLRCQVTPPRAVNVDIGYTTDAMLAELAAGVTSWSTIAGRYGTTAAKLIREKAENVQLIHETAKEFKIEPGEISENLADVIQKLLSAQKLQPGDEQSAPKKKQLAAGKKS